MPRRRTILPTVWLVLEAAGLAAYLSLFLQSRTQTILSHGFRVFGPDRTVFLGLGVLFLAVLGIVFRALDRSLPAALPNEGNGSGSTARSARPFALLLAAPLLHADFFNRADFQARLGLLGAFAAAAVVYRFWAERRGLRPDRPSLPSRTLDRFGRLPLKKRLAALALAAFVVYGACAYVLVRGGVTFSGDEPNYLLTTHSLLYDRDINLANNYANRDYFHFYEEKDNPRLRMGIYAREGRKGRDHIYPINLPGISALMVPFYALSQAFEGWARTFILKGSLAIWAVLLGLQLYLLALELWKRERLALGLWALYAFSTPVLFYAVHLYPEIPIALFSIYVYRQVRSGRSLTTGRLAFMGALLGTFFWFGLKFNLVFWPILAVAVLRLWRTQRPRAKIVALVAPALAGLVLFNLAVWVMYGSLSPYAVYEGVLAEGQAQAITRAFLELPHIARVETLLNYFLDQRDGLLLYAPFWAFALLGLIEMARRARRELVEMLLIAGPFVLNYAFFTHRQGFCPQGRVLAPVSWIGAVAVGFFLAHGAKRVFGWLFGLATAATAAVSLILLRNPNFLYQPTTHDYTQRAGDLFVHLGNVRLFLPPLLPSFIKVDNSGYLPNLVWAGLAAAFVAAYLLFGRKAGGAPFSRGFHVRAATALLLAGSALWVIHPRVPRHPNWTVRYSTGGALGFSLMPMGRGVVAKHEGEMYLHFEKDYRFVFASREPLKAIRLTYGSEAGEHEAKMTFFDLPLLEARTSREMKDYVFEPPASYRLRGLHLYEIGLTLDKKSDENLLVDPYLLKIAPAR